MAVTAAIIAIDIVSPLFVAAGVVGVSFGFSFAFSDGTLLRGHHDIGSGRCHFALAVEGAAIVSITREGCHDHARIDWKIEWMTLACGSKTLCPIHADARDDGRQLVLDIDRREAA